MKLLFKILHSLFLRQLLLEKSIFDSFPLRNRLSIFGYFIALRFSFRVLPSITLFLISEFCPLFFMNLYYNKYYNIYIVLFLFI